MQVWKLDRSENQSKKQYFFKKINRELNRNDICFGRYKFFHGHGIKLAPKKLKNEAKKWIEKTGSLLWYKIGYLIPTGSRV